MSSSPENSNPKTKKDFGKLRVTVKQGQPIYIGEDIVIAFKFDSRSQLQLLVIAPKEIKVRRG